MKRRGFLTAIAAVLPLPFLRFDEVQPLRFQTLPIDGGFIVPSEFVRDLTARKFSVTIPVSNELLADAGPEFGGIVRDQFTKQIREREIRALLDGSGTAQPRGFLASRRFTDAP